MRIVADLEGVFADGLESPLPIERDRAGISFPDAEPYCRESSGLGSSEDMLHECVGQAAAMARRVHVKPLDLDRPVASNHRGDRVESKLRVSDQATAGVGHPGFKALLMNLRPLNGFAVGRRTVRLHIRRGIHGLESVAKGSFGERRQLERVRVAGQAKLNRCLHQ